MTVWVFCFNSVKRLVFINILQMFTHFHIFLFLAQIRQTYPYINHLQIKKNLKVHLTHCFLIPVLVPLVCFFSTK